MPMRWFRVYASLLNNPKFQRLSDTLKVLLFNLWCITAEYDGVLPPAVDLAFLLRCQQSDVDAGLESLSAAGFLDQTGNGLQPHDWNKHQFISDTSTGRVKEFRLRKRATAVSETPNETVIETTVQRFTETEVKRPRAEQIQNRADAEQKRLPVVVEFPNTSASQESKLVEAFEAFIARYPNRIGIDEACRQWTSLVGNEITGATLPEVMAGLARWIASDQWRNENGKYIPAPAKWLRERKWLDHPRSAEEYVEPAPQSDGRNPYAEWVNPWGQALLRADEKAA